MLTVLRQRDFSLLWFAGLISLMGDWMLIVALPATVYELTGSALATGGILIANRIPAFLLGSVAGVFVDRWDRKQTMVIANLVRAPVLLLLLLVDSAERIWIAYVVAAALSLGSQFFRPAENALLPTLVGSEHLIPANALNALNDNLSRLLGPAVGGLLVVWLGLGGVAVVDAASFLIAAVMIAMIGAQSRAEREPASSADEPSLRRSWAALGQEWWAGLRLIGGNRVLRVVFAVMAIASLGEGVLGAAFWVFVEQALRGGPQEGSWLISAQALGGILGALVVGSRGTSRSPVFLLGWGAIGIGFLDLLTFNYPAFIPGVWLGVLFMALVGIPVAAFGTGYTTALQTEADDAFRGRVFGALNATSAMMMIVGALIAGVATERVGVVTILTIDSLAYMAGGVFALVTLAGVRGRRW